MHTPATYLHLLIDATGSMFPYTSLVVDGLNHYVDAIKRQTPGPVFASLHTFTETLHTLYTARPIHRVDRIRLEQYIPNGGTALYDALHTVLQPLLMTTQPQVVLVLTDGEDTCSATPLEEVQSLLKQICEHKHLPVFIGVDEASLTFAARLGFPDGCRVHVAGTQGLEEVFRGMANNTLHALQAVKAQRQLPDAFFVSEG